LLSRLRGAVLWLALLARTVLAGADGHGACDGALYPGIGRDGPRRCGHGRTSTVCVVELLTVLLCLLAHRHLALHGCEARLRACGDLLRPRAGLDSARASVVGDAGDVVHHHRTVVDVGDVHVIDAGDGAVIEEVVSSPVAAVVAEAGVAEAVGDTAVEADVASPVAAVEAVAVAIVAPVAGGPERAGPGSGDPDSGNPVVAGRGVSPVAGGPHVVGSRRGWLIVGGQLGWGLFCLEFIVGRVLVGAYLVVVGVALLRRVAGLLLILIDRLLVGISLLLIRVGRACLLAGLRVLLRALLTLVLGAAGGLADDGRGLLRCLLLRLGRVGLDGGLSIGGSHVDVCRVGPVVVCGLLLRGRGRGVAADDEGHSGEQDTKYGDGEKCQLAFCAVLLAAIT